MLGGVEFMAVLAPQVSHAVSLAVSVGLAASQTALSDVKSAGSIDHESYGRLLPSVG
jgi:hypothetical protein